MRATALGAHVEDDSAPKRTPLILLWTFCTLIWSIFTPPHQTFAARVLILQPLWALRIYIQDPTWVQDLLLFQLVHTASHSIGVWRLPVPSNLRWINWRNNELKIYAEIFGLLAACGVLAGGIVYRGQEIGSKERTINIREHRIDEQLLPPLLIPSRTTHSRLFPEKHAFSYSYLFVGIPVGVQGNIGNAISVDSQHRNWFHVSCEDYLARGGTHLGLAEKLKRYLRTQGVTDADYSFAYLVTAPRFLGYSFNPVSFWYLYDADAVLKYMILEVNNTFDERRIYLLNADKAKYTTLSKHYEQITNGSKDSPTKLVFSEIWDKDFHVSPFNSRNGSYSLRATDPLASYEESGEVRVDNTIVLRSSKESAKLVARILSEGVPREAAKIRNPELFKFIAAWWWVGLVTFPRIVWQAQKLFFHRKLHVWYRPEVTERSIGRSYTDEERRLECFFHAFLKDAVERSNDPLRVVYIRAHAGGDEVVLGSPTYTQEEDTRRTIVFEILSPAFYSRFVHYAHAKEAFDRECLATDDKNKTLEIKSPSLLPLLLHTMRDQQSSEPQRWNVFNKVRWSCLRRLRCPPPSASYHHNAESHSEYDVTDIRRFRDSELDAFVKRRCTDSGIYRQTVTKLFLALRFTLGAPVLLSALDCLLRVAFVLATMFSCDRWSEVDIMRRKESGSRESFVGSLQSSASLILLANVIHLWSFLKG